MSCTIFCATHGVWPGYEARQVTAGMGASTGSETLNRPAMVYGWLYALLIHIVEIKCQNILCTDFT